MITRSDVIAQTLNHPVLTRPTVGHELLERVVQGLGPRSTLADWTATVPQLADAIDTALARVDAATLGALAGSAAAGHALIVEYSGCDLVGACQCGRRLGRIRPGTALDALAVPWTTHTSTELAAAAGA
ncbi:hypothetical protein [Streptomyces gilvus]|uniref:hypothetical protein n=1 Tax=Streptomyces gilvus TaxID=2920937 RepID=UPI001F0D2F4A|nr:hypothetical protein [Streptomyces sp. CME 23]MCH5677858.1 hypothetical protein [Streptomyces sp. CME 23]